MESIQYFNGAGFPDYENLIDVERWRKIQNNFTEILNISLKTVNKAGEILVESSEYNPCNLISQYHFIKENFCKICLNGIKTIWSENYFYSCPLGFNYQAIPVEPIEEKIIAYVIMGPFLIGRRKDKEEIKNIASKYQIDYKLLQDTFLRLRVVSFQILESIKSLLYEVMQCVSQYYYQKYTLIEVIPEWQKIRESLGSYYFDKFIHTLIEVIARNTIAERISLMFYDPEFDELYIKAGRGIPDQFLKETRVKLGERISGLVAKEKKMIVIEEDEIDEKIKQRMSNPALKSAIVMPLQHEGKLIGVINIGSKKKKKFSPATIRLVSELMNLSSVAIMGMYSIR